jgi:osmotically inducible lipoprotein OsmB
MKKLIVIALATLAIAACTPREQRVATGAGIGGAGGALIGGLASGTAGGALAGAAIGAVGGAVVADVTRPKTTKRCWWTASGNKVCKYYRN